VIRSLCYYDVASPLFLLSLSHLVWDVIRFAFLFFLGLRWWIAREAHFFL
jgi:hypothetical protein